VERLILETFYQQPKFSGIEMSDSQYQEYKLYRYDPSIAAAVIFIILFFLVTVLHFYQMVRTKTYFFFPFAIGGIFEIIGFAAVSQTLNAQPTIN
jgi:hypothetical protein